MTSKEKQEGKPTAARSSLAELLHVFALTLFIYLFVKGTIAEARYIPSTSMLPTLQVHDHLLVDKLSTKLFGNKIKRGDILVFYPPAIETGVPDGEMSRFNGLVPFLPENPPAFIKRVIGLPGDHIVIKREQGVFINGALLKEAGYVAEKPLYDLKTEADIAGYNMAGHYIAPYSASDNEIVVPPGKLFMMGDNRNNSSDSHVWGYLDESRVVGRACLVFWKDGWIQNALSAILPNHH